MKDASYFSSYKWPKYLFPPKRALCVVRRLERGKKKAHKGRGEGEKEEERLLGPFPLPMIHRALTFF